LVKLRRLDFTHLQKSFGTQNGMLAHHAMTGLLGAPLDGGPLSDCLAWQIAAKPEARILCKKTSSAWLELQAMAA
jgi:hypothetical protein